MSDYDCNHYLTGIFRVHMRRVEAKVDEEGDGHSILEPLHHIGLAIQGMGHVASQDDVLSCSCCHKLRLLSHSVGTCGDTVHRSEPCLQAKNDLKVYSSSHCLTLQTNVLHYTRLEHICISTDFNSDYYFYMLVSLA